MDMDVGIITAVLLFLVITLFQTVEQRRTHSAYRKALANSKDKWNVTLDLQRETNRLLALIAERMNAPQK
jgi:hypothetical protein